MVKAKADGKNGTIIVMGISEENVRRLKQNEIMYFNTAQLHIEPGTHISEFTLFYGATDEALRDTLKGLIGPQTEVIVVPRGDERPQ